MEFFNSKQFMAIIIIVLVLCTLMGCAKKPLETQGPSQATTMDAVGKMKGIGLVIGCVFAPNNEECKDLRSGKKDEKPHESQEEYNQKVNNEWSELDEDAVDTK